LATVIWTRRARRGLQSALDYLEEHSDSAAERFARRIKEAVERIAAFPDAGRRVPESDEPSVRKVFVDRYRVIYRVTQTAIEILLVHHGARKLPPI
jgi:toxin ParE1/3/4